MRVLSLRELHRASLSPYVPILTGLAREGRTYTSAGEFKIRNYDLTLSYLLFDWGGRKAERNITGLNLDIGSEDVRRSGFDLELDVKNSFFNVVASNQFLEERRIQLRDAEKDYEVAQGRYKFGVAKLSDTLQASVRLEQARFNVIQGERDLKNSLSDLNSLIGRPLDTSYDIEGPLFTETPAPDIESLSRAALQRPEVRQAEDQIRISENSRSAARSRLLPSFIFDASYAWTKGDRVGFGESVLDEEKTAAIRANWNIFELSRFYNLRSAGYETDVSRENLYDIRRRTLLDVRKTYVDFITAVNQLKVAEEQLRQAEQNYAQAFGEYKVGTADILALVQAESALAAAREQRVASGLNAILSKSLLERTAGISDLGELIPH